MKNIFAILVAASLISCGDIPQEETKSADAEKAAERAPEVKKEEDTEKKFIPGLTAVDVHGNFTNKGFELEKDLKAGAATWTCTSQDGDNNYTVKVFGDSARDIDRIDATVMFIKENKDVREFLGYVASVPYEGGNPAVATAWALSKFDNGGDTLIGSVRFNLIKGTENSRVLKLNAH